MSSDPAFYLVAAAIAVIVVGRLLLGSRKMFEDKPFFGDSDLEGASTIGHPATAFSELPPLLHSDVGSDEAWNRGPIVNIDGTPMVNESTDIKGHPFGVTDDPL
jgi:hypothetical protein